MNQPPKSYLQTISDKTPVKRKRTLLAGTLLLAVLAALIVCGCGQTEKATAETLEPAAETVSETVDEVDIYVLYGDVLDMLCRSFENGWSELDDQGQSDVLDPDSVSYLLSFWGEYTLDNTGYAFVDLDENGIPELLIAPVEPDKAGELFDLYTVDESGQILHLASGGERARYTLGEDLSVQFEGSSSAFLSYQIRYRLDTTEHILLSTNALIIDSETDEEQPYFYTDEPWPVAYYGDGAPYETMTHLSSYEEAAAQMGSFDPMAIEVTPLRTYAAIANGEEG